MKIKKYYFLNNSTMSKISTPTSSVEEECLGGGLIKLLNVIEPLPSKSSFSLVNIHSSKMLEEEKIDSSDIFEPFVSNIQKTPSTDVFPQHPKNEMVFHQPVLPHFFKKKEAIFQSFSNQKETIFLQNTLRELPKECISQIVNNLSGSFFYIMQNKNGNYFFSDLLKLCSNIDRFRILNEIKINLFSLSLNEFSTHPIQTLIDLSNSEQEYFILINYIFNNDIQKVLQASLNPNGSYVVQKIITHIPEFYRLNFDIMIVNIIHILFFNMYGVCICKKFFSNVKNQLLLKNCFDLFYLNFVDISQNQYGNYLSQYILKNFWNDENYGGRIKQIIIENFEKLSMEKFSCHISELFVELLDYNAKYWIINYIVNQGYFNELAKNKFGVYVVKKLLKGLSLGTENYIKYNDYNNKVSSHEKLNDNDTNNNKGFKIILENNRSNNL